MSLAVITPDWPAPERVRAFTTTRRGGVSRPPYDSLNLGDHVGDEPQAVAENRRRLRRGLALPAEPRWLSQVHGSCSVDAVQAAAGCRADAAYTAEEGVVCAVLTADCLPLLLCDRQGRRVAAVHAGWRGLLEGVIEQTVARMGVGDGLLAWLGPAIGPQAFEVGEEVRTAFVAVDAAAGDAFVPSASGRWLADLYRLARQRLARAGVLAVYGGDLCTFSDAERFYSYRRDGRTGRMASLIWLARSGA
jgi:YfiH family protein